MNSPHTFAEAAETSYSAGVERVAELERQIAALQHLVAELLVKNQQLRDRNLNTTAAPCLAFETWDEVSPDSAFPTIAMKREDTRISRSRENPSLKIETWVP